MRSWRTVRFERVSVRVPASWPVLNLTRHPRTCPRLDRHAVYLGRPGPDPACPAMLAGKTGAVQLMPVAAGSPDLRAAGRPDVVDGGMARTNSDQSVSHTIIEIIPAAGVEVSLSYGSDLATVRAIARSITIRPGTQAGRTGAGLARRSPALVPAAAPQGLYQGPGFDTCAAPSAGTMTHWLASPYRAVGIYIGGVNRGCAQANLTASWITTVQTAGWHYFPFYVGLQASCVQAFGDASIVTAKAAAEGKAAADDAAVQARDLGIPPGTPIIYDMEAYGTGCSQQVITFLSAWDAELHADGYKAGIYESFSNIGDLISAQGRMTEPDVIHYADWDGKATTQSSYMPATLWTSHQRLHQYLGGHNETWGGATMNIDNDQLDVNLGGSPGSLPVSFRIALGRNSNGTAEWFAKAANGTVVHSYQHPVGSTTWAPARTVGTSPQDLVSDPAVAPDQDGDLALFAVDAHGSIVHAWQQLGAPNNWTWGGAAGSGSPGTIAGDPAAVSEPGGAVGVFVTDTSGKVVTTHQVTANANTSWTKWSAIGGSCASAPVPFPVAGRMSVTCVTTTGALAVTSMSAGSWTGWHPVSGLTGLTGSPAEIQAADGQADIFAATSSGQLDEAYLLPGSSTWAAGSGLPQSPRIQGSPSAIAWPGGGVAVFSQLSGGDVGYLVGTSGAMASWSAWTDLGSTILGAPAAWLDSSGEPQVAILTARRTLAVAGFTSNAWTGWTSLASGF